MIWFEILMILVLLGIAVFLYWIIDRFVDYILPHSQKKTGRRKKTGQFSSCRKKDAKKEITIPDVYPPVNHKMTN